MDTMEKNLKALFETRSAPPDIREEDYDSLNEETFSNMESWEQNESLNESGRSLTISSGAEIEGDSTSLKKKESDEDAEIDLGPCSKRRGADENDQEKDNMAHVIDSTLSHLGLGLPRQRQANGGGGGVGGGGDIKKIFVSGQRVNESLDGLSGGMEDDSLDNSLRLDTEDQEWITLSKQKSDESYRDTMNRSRGGLHQQRVVLDVEDGSCARRESFPPGNALERGDADRVVLGTSTPLISPRRGSGRFDSGRFERGNANFCRRFGGPNTIGQGGGSSIPGQGENASVRPENFDLRNVETFGMDAVQQHIQDHHHPSNNNNSSSNSSNNNGANAAPPATTTTTNNNSNNAPNNGVSSHDNNGGPSSSTLYGNGTGRGGHSTHSSAGASSITRGSRNCSRYDPDGSTTNPTSFVHEKEDGCSRLFQIPDPRTYDFYMDWWQIMREEAAAEEANPVASNAGNGGGGGSGSGGILSHFGSSNNSSHSTPINSSNSNYYNINAANESRPSGVQRRALDQRMGDAQFEAQMTELKHKVWEQLELAADLGPVIEIMEDVFDRLVDPTEPLSAEDRLKALQKLADNVSPDNVCNLVRLVHSRRLLMYTLAHLWSEVSLRDHVLELVSIMLRRLDTLLVSDGSDMVFAQKQQVFARIFHGCSMEQLIALTTCLLKAPALAVESKLGLFFIGRILECAEDADLSCLPPHWVEKCLPKLLQHLARVSRAEVVHELVGSRALEHVLRNMDGVSFMRAVHAANAQSVNTTSY